MNALEQRAERQTPEHSAVRGKQEPLRVGQPPTTTTRPVTNPRSGALDHALANRMLAALGKPAIRLRLWDGWEVCGPPSGEHPVVWFRDRGALYRTLLRPRLHFGDLYSDGRIAVEGDLVTLLERIYQGLEQAEAPGSMRRLNGMLKRRSPSNTRRRAEQNIHHHYDIGNDFYQLWLDSQAMQYTCAYYPDPAMSLEAAQTAKLHHVCRKLQLKPGDSVVEAGCGWGGLARFMASHYGVTVKAFNISREQVEFAREAALREGLDGQVEYVLDDYRNITGQYDVFVSVGMLEHVGPPHYAVLGKIIHACLKPEGRGLIHSIGRNRRRPLNAWIERRIFPGAYPPTLSEFMAIFEPNGLSVLDIENLRLHYAQTLHAWLERYEQHIDEVRGMFDEDFARAWRLYLSGSAAAFTTGELQLFQVAFTHAGNNQLPWSRAHQYADPPRLPAVD